MEGVEKRGKKGKRERDLESLAKKEVTRSSAGLDRFLRRQASWSTKKAHSFGTLLWKDLHIHWALCLSISHCTTKKYEPAEPPTRTKQGSNQACETESRVVPVATTEEQTPRKLSPAKTSGEKRQRNALHIGLT